MRTARPEGGPLWAVLCLCVRAAYHPSQVWAHGGRGGGIGREEGGGSGTQAFVYQKQPKSIFPFVNFIFSRDEIWVQGWGSEVVGGGGTPPPPTVVSRSNTSLGGGGTKAPFAGWNAWHYPVV